MKPGLTTATGARALLATLAVTAALGGAGAHESRAAAAAPPLPRGSERVVLDPTAFTTAITNPYWPMAPGTRWVYRESEPGGRRLRVVVTVTSRTRLLANGITAREVRDTVTDNGVLVEDTVDWYAQDRAGNVWYLGERTTEYENGKPVSTEGSFEAGVDGAQAGIAMPARPAPGLSYRQEHYAGHAEDAATVLRLGEQAEVPAGHYTDVVVTRDVNPLQAKIVEYKFYARGVGPVLAVGVSGGSGREELVSFTRGR